MSIIPGISRRGALAALGAGAVLALGSPAARSTIATIEGDHGISLLGRLAYPPGFAAFGYVNPDAPKGGTLRVARIETFDSIDTLRYPGRPPRDLRLIYDRLIIASDDETASYYGLLAESMVIADDFSTLSFRLNPAAHWHDGRPVTAEDVVFTFETLKTEGLPFFRQALRPVSVVADGPRHVTFLNERVGDRDIVRRLEAIAIHPAHVWRDRTQPVTPDLLLSSGPYRLADVQAPRRFVLERHPDYWAADLGVIRGRWNFDRLIFEFFRDGDVALEAFLADDYDLREETSPSRWRSGYTGPALAAGEIRQEEAPHPDRGRVHGLALNLRRRPLADRRVRLALRLAYDFDAFNQTLYNGAYQPFESVFGESDLAAVGAAGSDERAVLTRPDTPLDAAVLADPNPLTDLPPPGSRAALLEAARLLDEAGYPIRDLQRVSPEDGRPLAFSILSMTTLYDRPLTWLIRAWERLGINVSLVQTDPASASRGLLDRDFDFATLTWSPARLPGTAERLLWHSELANSGHSYALSGIASPALDAAIEALESARTQPELIAAGRAFDRVFRHAVMMLPLWRENAERWAWWDRFDRPAAEKSGFSVSALDRWWART